VHALESIRQQLVSRFSSLPGRDQRALALLVVAAMLLGLYLLRDGIAQANEQQVKRNAAALSQLNEMRQWAASIEGNQRQDSSQLMRVINSSATNSGLRFSVIQPVDRGVTVSVSGVDQAALMNWLANAQSQGLYFSTMSIRPVNNGVAFSAIVEAL
jgi:type II secretory pathway component PulM